MPRPAAPFAASLRHARRRAGLTQAALAASSGVPLRTLQEWEQGRAEPEGLRAADALAGALGISLDKLFGRDRK